MGLRSLICAALLDLNTLHQLYWSSFFANISAIFFYSCNLNYLNYSFIFILVWQMNHQCQSLATLTAFTAAWASPLQLWEAAKRATLSPLSTASSPLKTSSTTCAPTAPTAFLSHRGHFRHYQDTSLSSPTWSTLILPYLSWPKAAVLGSTLLWGFPWGQLTAPVQTSLPAAAADTQIFQPVLPPG